MQIKNIQINQYKILKCLSNISFSFSSMTRKDHFISISEEVEDAIYANKPIVALESTIISHGMPYPRNIEVAFELEEIIRSHGVVPATVAIINGVPKVGLNKNDFNILADKSIGNVIKASKRDIAYSIATKSTAATTVASTMILSYAAGIKVFATGGIGGVHYDGEKTLDISADLIELSKTPVTVVSAGIKSILDIPRTLEFLETHGVPVIGYKCDYFPAFFSNNIGIRSPLRLDDTKIIAEMMLSANLMKLNHGMIVGVPNPNPAADELIQSAINEALKLVKLNNITGHAITPFLLNKVNEITKGLSLESNISLVKNNCVVASKIALDYNSLIYRKVTKISESTKRIPDENKIVILGGAVVDIVGKIDSEMIPGSSNIGTIRTGYGGVGRNIAEKIAKSSDISVKLITAVGEDSHGNALRKNCDEIGIDTSNFLTSQHSTAIYSAIHGSNNDLYIGVADMNIFHTISSDYIKTLTNSILNSRIIVCDGNLSLNTFVYLIEFCHKHDIPVFFEPTSSHKCLLPIKGNVLDKITFMKPNLSELVTMLKYSMENHLIQTNKSTIQAILRKNIHDLSTTDIRILGIGLMYLMTKNNSASKQILISLGSNGILWVSTKDFIDGEDSYDDNIVTKLIPSKQINSNDISSTNGAGDSFCAGYIIELLKNKKAIHPTIDCIYKGIDYASEHLTKGNQ